MFKDDGQDPPSNERDSKTTSSDNLSSDDDLASEWESALLEENNDKSQNEEDLLAQEWEKSLSSSDNSTPIQAPENLLKGLKLLNESFLSNWDMPIPEFDADYEASISESNTPASEVVSKILNDKILDQSEIDSLLGFENENASQDKNWQGIKSVLNSGMIYYERLPMLEVVFDRLVRMLSTSLRNFTSDNVDISLESMSSIRFGEYLNSIPLPAMLGVFRAIEWDNQGLMVIDSPLIYSVVDVLLGGRRSIAAMRVEGRPYTTIERKLVEKLMRVFLTDLGTAFEPVSPVFFKFERLETNPRFAMIARPANAGIVVRLRVEMEERGGRISLMLPYATIEPIRELLLQNFMGEKFGRDSIWENHLTQELWQTEVMLQANFDEETINLSDVIKWKKGDQLLFNAYSNSLVTVSCGGHRLFTGKLGQKNGKVAVKVENIFIKQENEGDTANE